MTNPPPNNPTSPPSPTSQASAPAATPMGGSRYDKLVTRVYDQRSVPMTDRDPSLGHQIEQMVNDLAPRLAGSDRSGEGYLNKLGRLNAAQSQAVEIALHDLLPTSQRPTGANNPASGATTSSPESETGPEPGTGPDLASSDEALMPLTWPTDPAHPLNDPDLVEQMSSEEIRQQLQAFDQTPTQQQRLTSERDWRQTDA